MKRLVINLVLLTIDFKEKKMNIRRAKENKNESFMIIQKFTCHQLFVKKKERKYSQVFFSFTLSLGQIMGEQFNTKRVNERGKASPALVYGARRSDLLEHR